MARLPVDIMTAGNRSELPAERFVVEKATADTFGGQVGRAMEGLGEAGMALAVKINANQRKLAEFGYEDQFVKLQDADNTDYDQRHRGISGTADGWWQGARTATKARMDEWLKTLPESARAEYQVKADRFVAGRTSQAFKDQFGQQDMNTKQTLTEEQRKVGLQVQNDPATYEQFVQQQMSLIDKSTLPDVEKARLKAEARNSLAYTAELSRAQKDPEGVAKRAPPVFAPDVNSAIDKAAAANGLDAGMLRRFAQIESSGNPGAVTGSYKGLFQMSDAEFAKHGGGNIYSADDNANAAARKIRDEAASFKRRFGRDATATDLYMQHQQGVAGYAAHLANPNAPAWENMLGTAEGREKGGAWAKAAIWGNIPADVKAQFPGGVETVTSAAFVNVWRRKVDGYASATVASAALTPEQAAAVQETARRQTAAQEQQRAAQYEADQTSKRNQLYIDLKEGSSPDASYRAARQSGLLSDFGDIEKAERIIRERNKGDEDYGRGLSLMQGGRGAANPYDKEHRDGVQAFYDRTVKGGADPAATAAAVFDRTGIVPPAFATAMRGALASEDPARVSAGLSTAANMLRQNPNAFAGVEGGAELEKHANEYRRLTEQLGFSSDQATKRVLADARDTTRLDPVKQEQLQQFRKQSLSQDQIDARLRSNFSSWSPFSDAPFSVQLPNGPQRTAMASIYSEFAAEGFEKFRDPDKALAFADLRVQQQFGVQNGVLMRYPPAKAGLPKLAGTGVDGFGWVNEQAAGVVKDQLGVSVDPSQIVLVPVEREGVSTRAAFNGQPTTVTRGDSGQAAQRTAFQSVPYTITVMPKTPDQDVLVVHGVFFPDADTYVAGKNKAAAAGNEADATRIAAGAAKEERMLTTPEQRARQESAAKDMELRDAQARERVSREKFRAGTAGEVEQREATIAKLNARIAELDDTPAAQASRNLLGGEIMRLQGEIMQLNRRNDVRQRR
ncbi:MAG: hypothetical protein IPM11_01230 [Micropruina sp.]|nr:hypothetical protein [Micropruina sp.]